jgi:hypothetical protein
MSIAQKQEWRTNPESPDPEKHPSEVKKVIACYIDVQFNLTLPAKI